MADPTEIRLARLAIRRGLLTPEQVWECVQEQEQQAAAHAPTRPLGTLFLTRRLLDDAALAGLLDAFADVLRTEEEFAPQRAVDQALARLLVEQRTITAEQAEAALQTQAEHLEDGRKSRLATLLVVRGVSTLQKIAPALRAVTDAANAANAAAPRAPAPAPSPSATAAPCAPALAPSPSPAAAPCAPAPAPSPSATAAGEGWGEGMFAPPSPPATPPSLASTPPSLAPTPAATPAPAPPAAPARPPAPGSPGVPTRARAPGIPLQALLRTGELLIGEVSEYEIRSQPRPSDGAVLYDARDQRLDQSVELRVFLAPRCPLPNDYRRFLRAVEAWMDPGRHLNVVGVYNPDRLRGFVCLVSEYSTGATLEQLERPTGPAALPLV
ncbi:MAG: hypothetical protein HZA54_06355, partial [Planctomycetes bacterium]|nr:hypothetical protein [Planctomycetota bacterium]